MAKSKAAESFNFPPFTHGLEGGGVTWDGAMVMASSWCITCLHCSWSPGSPPFSPRIGLDYSPLPFGVLLVWQILGPLLVVLPDSTEHVWDFLAPLEKPLCGHVFMLAFLQDRKPVIMLNLLLILELAGEVLLPITSTPSQPVLSRIAAILSFFIEGPFPQLHLLYPSFPSQGCKAP